MQANYLIKKTKLCGEFTISFVLYILLQIIMD
jgi:hypothetical protein